ncbi:hypothetical protein [Streptomyces sp. Inha503]|uniref:hypothetical protein n=1 Tax=Streptomyces sp. Inha503 TaxID=3383314 RepID=UPI0039A151D9
MRNRKVNARVALLAATAALGVGSLLMPTASASSAADAAPASDMGAERAKAGWCTLTAGWGGKFYCGSSYMHKLPNGRSQAFVIGTNRQAYTKWQTASGLSGWKSMGGQCIEPGNDSIDLYWKNPRDGWNFTIQCKGTDHHRWLNTRHSNGSWSGWYSVR